MPKKDFLESFDKEVISVAPPRSGKSGTKKRDDLLPIDFKFENERVKLLKSRGVDGYAFSMARSPFVIEDALVRIKPQVQWLPEDFLLRSISVKKQINGIDRVLQNPLHGSYTMAIGSYPSDVRAKILALNIMNKAIDAQMAGSQRGRAYPLWHRLYGNFQDPLRDSKEPEHISMLVITNVGVDSSQVKLEKLRDLLERYDSIPRIVVVNGVDPVSFFAERVRLPLKYAFYLSAEQKASILDI